MAIKGQNLDQNFKENFAKMQYQCDRVFEEDLAPYLHQNQEDALASGETSENVKKFFDYIPLRVFLPWLQTLTGVANVAALLSTRFAVIGEFNESGAKTLQSFVDAVGRSYTERILVFVGNENALYMASVKGAQYRAGIEGAEQPKVEDPLLLANAETLQKAVDRTIKEITMDGNRLRITFLDGDAFLSDDLKGDKGDPGENGAPGIDGKTPEKGVDYFTEKDIQQLLDTLLGKDLFVQKQKTSYAVILTQQPDGSTGSLDYAYEPIGYTVPRRGATGALSVGEPTNAEHAATKKYVDEKTATETWAFTLEDGTVVEKKVVIG